MYELFFIDLLNKWGYVCLFAGMFLEGLSVPFPGALFVIIAGALVVKLKLSMGGIICCAFLGYTVGSLIPYYAAKLGGRGMLDRYGRYIYLTPTVLNVAEYWFQKYGKWVVCLSRPFFFGNYISYLAGITKMKTVPFVLYTALGALPWCGVLGLAGFYCGQAGLTLLKTYSGYTLIALLLLFGVLYRLKAVLEPAFVKLKLSWLKT